MFGRIPTDEVVYRSVDLGVEQHFLSGNDLHAVTNIPKSSSFLSTELCYSDGFSEKIEFQEFGSFPRFGSSLTSIGNAWSQKIDSIHTFSSFGDLSLDACRRRDSSLYDSDSQSDPIDVSPPALFAGFYEKSTSFLTAMNADQIMQLIRSALGDIGCECDKLDQPFVIAGQSMHPDHMGLPFRVNLFTWPPVVMHSTVANTPRTPVYLVEFQRRAGDSLSFDGLYERFCVRLAMLDPKSIVGPADAQFPVPKSSDVTAESKTGSVVDSTLTFGLDTVAIDNLLSGCSSVYYDVKSEFAALLTSISPSIHVSHSLVSVLYQLMTSECPKLTLGAIRALKQVLTRSDNMMDFCSQTGSDDIMSKLGDHLHSPSQNMHLASEDVLTMLAALQPSGSVKRCGEIKDMAQKNLSKFGNVVM
eukprot:46007_1